MDRFLSQIRCYKHECIYGIDFGHNPEYKHYQTHHNRSMDLYREIVGRLWRHVIHWNSENIQRIVFIGTLNSQLLTVCPSCGPGSIPNHGGAFEGTFPWLIALCQPVLSQRGRQWLNLPSMTSHSLWTARRKAEANEK